MVTPAPADPADRHDDGPRLADVPGIVVDAGWLADNAERVIIADARWYLDGRDARASYETGHIPAAVFVDLDTALSSKARAATEGRHPLPEPEQFALAMTALGIGDGTVVVAYDDSGGGTAGRLVWMLRALGESAALLDGGLRAWTGAIETGPGRLPTTAATAATAATATATATATASFTARAWPASAFADWHEVETAGSSSTTLLVDARGADRYRGDNEPIDPRAGHIPGAINVPWSGLLDPATDRFLAPPVLRERLAAAGIDGTRATIASCGSGVSACAVLVALEHAGHEPGRLFVPSWSGWSADPKRPAAIGADPGSGATP